VISPDKRWSSPFPEVKNENFSVCKINRPACHMLFKENLLITVFVMLNQAIGEY
jgi:hypothetical protein